MVARRATLDEATVISRYFARPAGGDVVLGIGDDAAVLRPPRGRDLVVATDALYEDIHFPRGTPARAIGHRALAVNLSDLAAMGAEPLWATLALALPVARAQWLAEFSRGLLALAEGFGVRLVGGDTVRGPLSMTVTVLGSVRPGRAVTREGARPGDGVWVTGHPGDAVAGRLLPAGRRGRDAAALRRRFLYPLPRVAEGRALAGIASAMMDISDGLHDDLGKLLRASGCAADLDAGALPLSAPLLSVAGEEGGRQCALTGGDDYELLFTVPAAREARLRRLASGWSCPVTRIGTVRRGRGPRWSLGGHAYRFVDRTYRHFPAGRPA